MIYILSFYTCCQIEAILKIAKFKKKIKNWRKIEVGSNFLVKGVTGSKVCYLDSQSSFLHFELLIDVLAHKLMELWHFQNLTYL